MNLNIVELSQIGEKVVKQTTLYVQRVMKMRHDSAADIRDHAESLRETSVTHYLSKPA